VFMRKISITIILLFITTPYIFCGSPEIVKKVTQLDFVDSKLESVKVYPDGRVSLSNSLDRLWQSEEDTAVWSLAVDSKGRIFAGTGNDGKIYCIGPAKKTSLFFDSPETAILSLLIGPDGSLFAGTAPDGLIYKIDKHGHATIFARTKQHYVWDLAFDKEKNIVAAVGDKAKIIRYSSSGSVDKEFEIAADHVRCIALSGGDVVFGTAGPASIYRIHDNDIQAVYDASQAEISAIASDKAGVIYFSAVVSSAISGTEIQLGKALKPRTPDEKNHEENTLYRINTDGLIESWWSTRIVPVFDVAIKDNLPVIACGGEGYLFRIEDAEQATLMGAAGDQAVIEILSVESNIYLGTSTQASVIKISDKISEEGYIESAVYDAGAVSRWGTFSIISEQTKHGETVIETRSGNRKEPDEFWSEWIGPELQQGQFLIQSPPARFLQWRVTIKRKNREISPVLERVEFSVAKPNRSPRLTNIIVYPVERGTFMRHGMGSGKMYTQEFPDGTKLQYIISSNKGMPGLSKGQWFKLRGMRTVYWACHDPDKDEMNYDIAISQYEKNRWVTLETEYKSPVYSFDSTAFPDGRYKIRITASDNPSNPEGSQLTALKISRSFIVDNTPPKLLDIHAARTKANQKNIRVSGKAYDQSSRIRTLEYSFDSKKWYPFISSDGILDSGKEVFDLIVEAETDYEEISFKATDSDENVSSVSTSIITQ